MRSHSQALSRGGLPKSSRKEPGTGTLESSSWAAREPGGKPGSLESEPVARAPGERVLSGAYCVAGAGELRVDAVGGESFAQRLAQEARGTRAELSPLQQDVNRILRLTVAAMVPLAVALGVALWLRGTTGQELASRVVAALVPLVPEGLVLLTSLTFAVAAVRLARLGTLAQE